MAKHGKKNTRCKCTQVKRCDKREQDVLDSLVLDISVCIVHFLPLRILNVSMAHANPAVQLRPESMQTDTCVSAVKVFQGLFSHTLLHIFHFYIFCWNKNRSSSKKESLPLVLPNVWQKTQFRALQEQQVSWFSFSDSLYHLFMVYLVKSVMLVPVGRQRICALFQPHNTHQRGWGCSIKERHMQASLAKHAFQIKPQHSETDSLRSHSE